MKKVLAIIEAATVTGPAKNLLGYARRSRASGIDFRILTYTRSGTPRETQLSQAAAACNIPLLLIHEDGRFDLALIERLRAAIEEFNPDIVQTHNYKSHFLLRCGKAYRRRPWIAFHHGYTSTDLKDVLMSYADLWSLRRASKIITVCSSFRAELAAHGLPTERIEILHNSVEGSPISIGMGRDIQRSMLGLREADRLAVFIGRLSKEKAPADLLIAFAKVARLRKDVQLQIIGEGIERPALESLIERLKLNHCVHLAGFKQDIQPYYRAADLFVLPSHSEGSPNVLLEAMAAGLPVVATHVGGVPDICVHGETGIIVRPRHPEELASAIIDLLANPNKADTFGRAGRKVALDRFSVAAYDAQLNRIYANTLA